MLAKSFIFILTSKIILAQINGEFWWLSDKLPYVKHVEPPIIEDDNEHETDETAKILFRDKDFDDTKLNAIQIGDKNRHDSKNWKIDTYFRPDNRIIFPNEENNIRDIIESNKSNVVTIEPIKREEIGKKEKSKAGNEDEFKFYFPDDYLVTKNKNESNKVNTISTSKKKVHHRNKVTMVNKETLVSENICKYINKRECYRQNGIIYKQTNNRIDSTSEMDDQLICCVMPLIKEELSRLIFPGPSINRQKRSKQNDGTISVLKQREVLLKRRYGMRTSVDNKRDTNPKITTDEVEEEHDVDPYWNIKNSKLKFSSERFTSNTKHDCYEEEEDYVIELPKPGLLGVYSDHNRPGWPVYDNTGSYGDNAYDDNYDDDQPGYSTIDPRRDITTSKFSKRGQPSKLSTISEENYDPESHTISYQSNPDFQVLQGFKLINLSRNKNKFYSNSKKITTESVVQENSEESVLTESSSENRNKDFVSINRQIYKNCGKVTGNFVSRDGKQLGSSENGSHPWLALVVLSKRRQSIVCYATIVHPRAALTAADCIYGRSNGEIMLAVGLRDLKNRGGAQYRTVATLLHPQYKPNELAHNLAVLHWNLPLQLTVNVQPACLGEPQAKGNCFVYGWGGYDQAIRSRSRCQRATVLPPRQCQPRLSAQLSKQLPTDAFCAEVQARGTVTGIGGGLVCEVMGRQYAAGVAVWRHSVLVLLPTKGWPEKALDTLLGSS